MLTKAESRAAFRTLFMEWIGTIHYGDLILYQDVEEWAKTKHLDLSQEEIKKLVGSMEIAIGKKWHIGLQCLRKRGWKIIAGDTHAEHNGVLMGTKLRHVIIRGKRRDAGVALDDLSLEAKERFMRRGMAAEAILQFTKPLSRGIDVKQLTVLNEASVNVGIIELCKKQEKDKKEKG